MRMIASVACSILGSGLVLETHVSRTAKNSAFHVNPPYHPGIDMSAADDVPANVR